MKLRTAIWNIAVRSSKTVRPEVRPGCPLHCFTCFLSFYIILLTVCKPAMIFFLFYLHLLPLSRIHSCRHLFGFIRCKGLLSRLIRRLEVHFLQILPFCARVIGRKSRRMKLFRQPCTASIKPQSGSGRKRTEQRETKKIKTIQVMAGLTTLPQNIYNYVIRSHHRQNR